MRTGPDCGIFSQWPCSFLEKPKPSRADDDAVFERDVVAEDAVLSNDGVGVREEVAAHLNAGIEHDVRQDRRVRADADAGTDDGVCADVRAFSDDSRGINDRCGDEFRADKPAAGRRGQARARKRDRDS